MLPYATVCSILRHAMQPQPHDFVTARNVTPRYCCKMQPLADRLALLLKGKSIAEEARALNMGRTTLTNHKLGARNPDTKTVIAYARRYRVSADYLLGLTDDPSVRSWSEASLSEQGLNSIVEETRTLVIKRALAIFEEVFIEAIEREVKDQSLREALLRTVSSLIPDEESEAKR